MAGELIRVPFHGDTIEAVQDERGVWVPIKRPCENLGVGPDKQRQRLLRKSWAVTSMMEATGPDGKRYEMFCIHLDCLPMWLATIEVSRVKLPVRPKLEVYQKDCAKVLRDHFFGPRESAAPKNPFQMMRLMLDQLEAQDQRLCTVEGQVGQMVATQERATLELRTVERSAEAATPLTVRDKVNQLVRASCRATGANHSDTWGRLYRELFYSADFNAQVRARNAGKIALDCVEEAGHMPELYAIASANLIF